MRKVTGSPEPVPDEAPGEEAPPSPLPPDLPPEQPAIRRQAARANKASCFKGISPFFVQLAALKLVLWSRSRDSTWTASLRVLGTPSAWGEAKGFTECPCLDNRAAVSATSACNRMMADSVDVPLTFPVTPSIRTTASSEE